MAENAAQLAALGEQLVNTIIAAYNPENDPSVALSIHPGQAIADALVQNGVTNPLRLSEWIEGQYDYPLQLKRSTASRIAASSIGNLTAKGAYLAMIPWAQPKGAVDEPGYGRVEHLISAARQDLGGDPESLPFGCEPANFAQTEATCWQVFDQVITTSTQTSTTPPAPGRVGLSHELWKLRAITADVVSALPSASAVGLQRRANMLTLKDGSRADMLQRLRLPVQAEPLAAAPKVERSQYVRNLSPRVFARITPMQLATSVDQAGPEAATSVVRELAVRRWSRPAERLDERRQADVQSAIVSDTPSPQAAPVLLTSVVLDRLASIQIVDLVATPAVPDVTTEGSSLHAHFEYCLLKITRQISGRPWWHGDLVMDDGWFVQGMKAGEMLGAMPDADLVHGLPQALILVRNVAFTGTWSAEAVTTMNQSACFLGPFLIRPGTRTVTGSASSEQLSVLGEGIQVIGELCSILPALPPSDDPGLAAAPIS